MTTELRIGICGSASVGKTTLAHALACDLGLPCIEEEMRAYIEGSGADLSSLPSAAVEEIILQMWEQRRTTERTAAGFIADNCSIDFAAYALYYGCLSPTGSRHLLVEAGHNLDAYDAVVLLPWGVLPYQQDGVRPANQHLQLRYQFLLEGLLWRYVPKGKLYVLPEHLVRLDERRAWVADCLVRARLTKDPAIADRKHGMSKAIHVPSGTGVGVAP